MLAVLSKEIKFTGYEGEIVVFKKGCDVYIDPNEGIAFCEGYHFDIGKDEYTVIN